MTSPLCLYCDEADPRQFSGREHVIPQAFATFGSRTPTLKTVCDGCNAIFGKELDQMLARETLEGVTRYRQGRLSSEMRVQRRLRFTLADEEEVGQLAGAVLKGVDSTTNQLLPMATQLQILNRQTAAVDIFTREQLGTFELTEEIYGPPGARKLNLYAPSKEEHDAFLEELNAAGLDLRMEGLSLIPITPKGDDNGNPTLGVHVEGTFDQLHRRALAKIFVNFVEYYGDREMVRSAKFAPLKRFIRYGEGELKARLSGRPFWTGQETDTMRLADAINIRVENHQRGIVGVIQFYNQTSYELLLVEGAQIGREIAARFLDGKEPEFGFRGPLPSPGSGIAP